MRRRGLAPEPRVGRRCPLANLEHRAAKWKIWQRFRGKSLAGAGSDHRRVERDDLVVGTRSTTELGEGGCVAPELG